MSTEYREHVLQWVRDACADAIDLQDAEKQEIEIHDIADVGARLEVTTSTGVCYLRVTS